jgi:glycopeptide antibiotics resistance protein
MCSKSSGILISCITEYALLHSYSIALILYIAIFTCDIGTIKTFKKPIWEPSHGMWMDIFLNILLFIPFGFLLGGGNGARCLFFV